MPVCEGLPNGPCPSKRNDTSVVIGKGDLLLCSSCDLKRRRLFEEDLKSKEKEKDKKTSGRTGSSKSTATDTQSSRSGNSRKTNASTPIDPNLASSSVNVLLQQATNALPTDESRQQDDAKVIINELLAYAVFYRDRCTSSDLHKLIVHFYAPSEISNAKTTVTNQFDIHLSGCQFVTNRRHTSSRPAHDAEAEDILGILELLDNRHVLGSIQFAAVSIDRLPKYGPNEANVCTVADKQINIDKVLTELKESLHGNGDALFSATSEKMLEQVNTRLTAATDTFNGQLRQFEALCQNLKVMTSAVTDLATTNRPTNRPPTTTSTPTDDRAANIIVFGLAEDRDSSAWNTVLSSALKHVAGRSVEIADAFRIGRYSASQVRHRPIIVKLRNIWDKRLVLSNARKLSEIAEFRRIGFAPDEPLETRRKNAMKRLHHKATQEGRQPSLSADGDCLFVDGVLVFSMNDGLIRNGSNASNSNQHTNG